MFDSRHLLEPLLNREQAATLVKVHPKALQRYARNGLVASLRGGKQWSFRPSISATAPPEAVNSEQLSVPPHHS